VSAALAHRRLPKNPIGRQQSAPTVLGTRRLGRQLHDLAVMIRGRSTHNPVLLFLAGGPGGTEYGATDDLPAGLTRGSPGLVGTSDPTPRG
jgi:hypothetical protein